MKVCVLEYLDGSADSAQVVFIDTDKLDLNNPIHSEYKKAIDTALANQYKSASTSTDASYSLGNGSIDASRVKTPVMVEDSLTLGINQ